jgi:transcription elongation factor GreA
MVQQTYLTREGLAKLQGELEELRTVRRQEVALRIQRAKEIGGTVDNAEYDEAKNEQAFIEGRILTLENLINKAVLISEDKKPSGTVQVGSKVVVTNEKGEESEYFIVGSTEADPSQRKISNVSPIGKALLGKRVGGVAEVRVPAGRIKLKIKKIQ